MLATLDSTLFSSFSKSDARVSTADILPVFDWIEFFEAANSPERLASDVFVSANTNVLIAESSIAPSPDSIFRLALAATGVIEFTLFVSI